MHSTQLSLFAAVSKKPSPVPVFLIYAGVIHAIGLALLLPMLITLPGPGSEVAPEAAAIDVEIIPAAPLAGRIEPDVEQTSALPSASPGEEEEEGGVEADQGEEAVAPSSPEAAPEEEKKTLPQEEPKETDAPQPAEAEPPAKPAKATEPKPAKKAAATRRTGKPSARRAAKTQTKIAPFGGALSGLFSPGAPANNRRR